MFGSLNIVVLVVTSVGFLWHPVIRGLFISVGLGVGLLLLGYNLAKYQEID